MLHTPVLTEDQVKEFQNQGFLVVRGAFSPEEISQVERWTTEVSAWPEVSGMHWVFHEKSLKNPNQDLICRIERTSQFHPGFRMLAEALRVPTGQLLGEEAALFKEKINFKMPGGDGFAPHQDSQAGWEDYADFFISVMCCIDEATLENGCLKMVSGYHRKGLFRVWEPLTDDDMGGMEFVPCPTKPGDIVFFDSYAPHASDPNMSDKIRRLYFATYNRLADGDHMEKYYADKYKSFPPDIDRDPTREYKFRV